MKFFLIFIFALLMLACKEKPVEEGKTNSPLYDEVMAIHDKVMPEMSTLHALKRDLKAIEKPETRDIILRKIISLDNADDAMMNWMAEFKVPEDKTKEEKYLTNEKEAIQNVSDQMYASMDQAQKLLDSLKLIK